MQPWAPKVLVVAGVAVAAVFAAGCGSGGSSAVRTPTSVGSATSPSVVTTFLTSPKATSASASPGAQHVTITPSQQLTDGQHVQVRASGFTPGEALQVIQCADKGTATGPGDCNLSGMLATNADSSGSVQATVTVLRGPFGGNAIVCSTAQPCLISVTQATLSPTEEADARISFAG